MADRNTKNGTCYECSSKIGARWYVENKEHVLAKLKEWCAANSDKLKEDSKAYRAKNKEKLRLGKIEYYRENAEEVRVRASLWKLQNPERVRAHNNNRRAVKLSAEGSYDASDVERLLKSQGGRCAVCFVKLNKKYHTDHIVPLSRGGTNWPTNLQITCAPCNLQKGAMDPIEFMQSRGKLL